MNDTITISVCILKLASLPWFM